LAVHDRRRAGGGLDRGGLREIDDGAPAGADRGGGAPMTITTTAGHERADPRPAPEPARLGVLGAARIAELAIVKPARATGTRLVAVAARDQERASGFAAEHGVERARASYEDVVASPDVEAVYNPLPNALHGTWNLAAIDAGKHVLSEKPFAA